MAQQPLFQPLNPGRKSPASIAFSVSAHVFVALALLLAPVAVVHRAIQPKQTLTFVAPVEEYKAKKIELPKIKLKQLVLPPTLKAKTLPEVRYAELPKIVPPPVVDLPKIALNNAIPAPKIEATPVRPSVKTDVFATPNTVVTNLGPKSPAKDVKTDTFGTQAAATGPKSPDRSVQTGGFGDPNGVAPSKNSTGKGVVLAAFGSTELPVGGGHGGGGGRQVVGSAGFGGGFASAGQGGTGTAKGAVRASGFGETTLASAPVRKDQNAPPKETQVEIVSKPKPIYTAEAKELKIEGQVALEVQFNAAGSVRVVRVLKGLGHGLDEAALQAAGQIRFRPATRDGAAVDSTGRVYIVFQLS